MKIIDKLLEAGTAYATGVVLFLQDINWAMVGGLVLFVARAAVDIPKAIDYWKDRNKHESK